MEEVKKIYSHLIDDPVNPMRSDIDRDKIFELAESIKREGLINPITVRPVHVKGCAHEEDLPPCKEGCLRPGDNRYEVVAGHRRFMACKIANVGEISCVVRELTDEQAMEIMAHENLFRQDIDPVDEAIFLGRLVGEDETKISDIATKMSRSEQWVRDRLEILAYPDYMLAPIKTGELKLGVAKWLGVIDDD